MSRHISRSLLRSSNAFSLTYRAPQSRRFLSTAPPGQRSRSWKSAVLRWGLAGGALYYYNTSSLFADNPTLLEPLMPDSPTDETSLPTLDSIAQQRQASKQPPHPQPSPLDPEATESEASREGAFNEETGEINWDCPCLGGMAHGPCGDQFRQAFSCFVFSKEEPKGMDCIEHFKTMQGCFREHPDVYGGELEEDEVEEGVREQQQIGGAGDVEAPKTSVAEGVEKEAASANAATTAIGEAVERDSGRGAERREQEDQSEPAKTARAKEATEQVRTEHKEPLSETDVLVPKAAHDARTANEGK